MAFIDYKEQYKHPKWQKRRLQILERDNFTCKKCGDTETTLHVHHLIYYKGRTVWNYIDFDLITLCEHCHVQIENIKPNKADFKKIKIYKSNGWVAKNYIMFVVVGNVMSVEIFDKEDSFITGFNFHGYELSKIKPLMNTVINKWKNG